MSRICLWLQRHEQRRVLTSALYTFEKTFIHLSLELSIPMASLFHRSPVNPKNQSLVLVTMEPSSLYEHGRYNLVFLH